MMSVPRLVRNALESLGLGRRAVLSAAERQNVAWLVTERIARICAGLLVTAWVGRYLGPANYGNLSYCVAYVSLWGSVAALGIDAIVVRELSRDGADPTEILRSAFWIRAWSALTVTGLAIGFAYLASSIVESPRLMLVLAALSLLVQPVDIIDYYFQATLKSRRTVRARIFGIGLGALGRLVLITAQAPAEAFAAMLTVESIFFAIVMFWQFRSDPPAGSRRASRTMVRRLLADGVPILVSNFAILFYMRFDQILLRQLGGANASGTFAASLPFVEGWYVIGMSISTSLLPRLSRLFASDRTAFLEQLRKAMRAVLFGALLIVGLVSLVARPLVESLFGTAYGDSVEVLRIQIWSLVFIFLGVMENIWIITGNRRRLRAAKAGCGAVTNVLLNVLLIPRFGAAGCAMSAVASQAVSTVLSNAFLARDIWRLELSLFLPVSERGT